MPENTEGLKGYNFNGFYLDIVEKKLIYNDNPLVLENWDFEILHYLILKHPDFARNEDIQREVFPKSFIATQAKSVTEKSVHRIRKIFAEIQKTHGINNEKLTRLLIETKTGVGYRLHADIEPEYIVPRPPAPVPPPRNKPAFAEWLSDNWFALAVSLLICAGIVVSWIISGSELSSVNETDPAKRTSGVFVISGSLLNIVIILGSLGYHQLKQKKQKRFREIEEDFKDGEVKEEIKSIGYETEKSWKYARKIAQLAFERYSEFWGNLLFIWLLLYIFIGCVAYFELKNPKPQVIVELFVGLIRNLFNNLNTLFVSLCFIGLYKPIKIIVSSGDSIERVKDWYSLIGASIAFILLGVELISFISFYEVNFNDPNSFIWKPVDDPAQERGVTYVFRLISGFLGGVALALYIGRLQSKFFGFPNPLLLLLFSYVSIQPLFVLFNNVSWTAFIVYLALILKCIIIVLMLRLFHSGRLLYYFVRSRQDYEKEWRNFSRVLK